MTLPGESGTRADNTARAYSHLAGVLASQQRDPFCHQCKAFVNSVNSARERLARSRADQADAILLLPGDLQALLSDAAAAMHGLFLPENVPGQKKAGHCKLPQGVCLVKASLAILEKTEYV